MKNDIRHEVEGLENVLFVCFGRPTGSDLPQVGNPDSVVIDLLQDRTGKCMREVGAVFHHQTDPSYQ